MNNNRATLEVIAQSIEEAIEKGLADLGLSRDKVDITVLDEGGSGLLGFGSRKARVRISVLGEGEQSTGDSGEAASQTKKTPDADKDDTLRLTEEIVSELLEKMNLEATVDATILALH